MVICELYGAPTKAETSANAAIMARAPDMLAALHRIVVASEHRHTNCPPGPYKRMPPELRVAIAAARDLIPELSLESPRGK